MTAAAMGPRLRCLMIALVGPVWLAGCASPTSPPPPSFPSITCPADVDIQSPDDSAVPVSFTVPVALGGTAPVAVACAPASGTAFPVGTTLVSCVARDAASREAACSFRVSVRPVPRLQFTRFLAFGDSLTFGVVAAGPFVSAPYAPFNSYPFKLQELLAQRYTKQSITVQNAGIAGEFACCPSGVSEGGRQRLPNVLASQRPEVLLLMEGTNDLLELEPGADRAIAALEDMVREGKTRGARVFIATIPPQRSGGARNRDRVAAIIPRFNDQIRALAMRQSVTVIDVFGAIQPELERLIGPDDLHPTAEGYTVVAQRFYDVIRANLEVPTSFSQTYVP